MIKVEKSSQLTLFLTNMCNLNCIYCYEKNKSKDVMSFEVATKWIQRCLKADDDNHLNIYLFGGEPLLQYPLIKMICEWTWGEKWERSYSFIVQTNGTVLDDEKKEWFKVNKSDIRLCLSLDGDPDTHNRNRSNSYEMIDIPFFLETWPSQPVKMTISKFNMNNLAHSIIYLHEQGFNIRGCNFAIGESEYDESFFFMLSKQLKELADYYIMHPTVTPAPILNVPLHILSETEHIEHIGCNIGRNELVVVNTDGSTSPCSFFSNISLKKKEQNELSYVLNDINYKNIDCFGNCPFFPICDMCYGENYRSTGNIYKHSINKCKLMKLRIKAAMYLQSMLIAQKKEITYEDLLVINTIKKYQSLKIN